MYMSQKKWLDALSCSENVKPHEMGDGEEKKKKEKKHLSQND